MLVIPHRVERYETQKNVLIPFVARVVAVFAIIIETLLSSFRFDFIILHRVERYFRSFYLSAPQILAQQRQSKSRVAMTTQRSRSL